MLKFVTLALLAVSAASGADQQQSEQQELADKYRDAVKKYSGLPPVLPSSSDSKNVQLSEIKFCFYGTEGPDSVVEGTLADPGFPQMKVFNASLETKMHIHGWLEKNDNRTYKDAVMQHARRGMKVNLISVDWSSYSYGYPFSPLITDEVAPKVAEYVVQMLQRLLKKGADEKRIHMIGADLGAHIAGLAGKHMAPVKVGRITGLSPTGFYYNLKPEQERLNAGDADFVDVIHTNWGTFGISYLIGDLDFFPQGGKMQPAALHEKDAALRHLVSHRMANKYFMESVDYGYEGFIGKRCSSWKEFVAKKCVLQPSVIMGLDAIKLRKTLVYMYVNSAKPYSDGVRGLYEQRDLQISETGY